MDSSIGRTFSSGVFQARNDIPNYNRFVFGVDYTEAFALALLKQEAPNLYQEYQDILAGNKTMKSKRTLDFTRQGKGVIKSIKSTPAIEAQQFLSQVSGQLLWSLLKIPVTLQTYDENGHLVTQDFALQRNQVNYVDEWICETGNIAAPYYSDNGITLIPLQLTNSSIYANLKRAIETGEWWSVVSQKIHFDIGAEKTDTNGKGEVKVYYMPPGENFIYSWSNLEMNQNANYSTPFAYADGKTAVWIKLSNRIGNNGEYQSVRNTIERVNTSNIVNSAGIIAILSNRRDQFGKNPCLEQIPDNILTSLDQIEQIVPDGSCRVTAVIQTRGDNPNSQADEVYRQIGRMLIDGELALPDGGGSGGGQSAEIARLMALPKGIVSNVNASRRPRSSVVTYSNGTNEVVQEYELGITVRKEVLELLQSKVNAHKWYEMEAYAVDDNFRYLGYASGTQQMAIRPYWEIITPYDYIWAGILPGLVNGQSPLTPTIPSPNNIFSREVLGNPASFPSIYGVYEFRLNSQSQLVFNINGSVLLGGGGHSLNDNYITATAVTDCTQSSGIMCFDIPCTITSNESLSTTANAYLQSEPSEGNSNFSFKNLWSKIKNVGKNVIGVVDTVVSQIIGSNELFYMNSPIIQVLDQSLTSGYTSLDTDDKEILNEIFGRFPVESGIYERFGDLPNANSFKRIEALPANANQFYNMTFSFDFTPDLFVTYNGSDGGFFNHITSSGAIDIIPIPFLTVVNPSTAKLNELLNGDRTIFLGDLTTHMHSFTFTPKVYPQPDSENKIEIVALDRVTSLETPENPPYSWANGSQTPILGSSKGGLNISGTNYHCSVSVNFLPPNLSDADHFYLGFFIGYKFGFSIESDSPTRDSRFYLIAVPNNASSGPNSHYLWYNGDQIYPQIVNGAGTNAFFHISNIVLQTSFINQQENPQQAV